MAKVEDRDIVAVMDEAFDEWETYRSEAQVTSSASLHTYLSIEYQALTDHPRSTSHQDPLLS